MNLFMTDFDCPEVTLCGRQDIKIQVLIYLLMSWCGSEFSSPMSLSLHRRALTTRPPVTSACLSPQQGGLWAREAAVLIEYFDSKNNENKRLSKTKKEEEERH